MFTKVALAAALIAATTTVSLAAQRHHQVAPNNGFQSSYVRLNNGNVGQPDQEIEQIDRASSPYAGGVG